MKNRLRSVNQSHWKINANMTFDDRHMSFFLCTSANINFDFRILKDCKKEKKSSWYICPKPDSYTDVRVSCYPISRKRTCYFKTEEQLQKMNGAKQLLVVSNQKNTNWVVYFTEDLFSFQFIFYQIQSKCICFYFSYL